MIYPGKSRSTKEREGRDQGNFQTSFSRPTKRSEEKKRKKCWGTSHLLDTTKTSPEAGDLSREKEGEKNQNQL